MTLDFWDVAAVASKTVLYAATLAAAGGAAFLIYAVPLAQEQRRHIARGVYGCALAAAIASVARIAVMAATMSGDIAGLWDLRLVHLVLGLGEGRALFMRCIGLALIVLLVGDAGTHTRVGRRRSIGLACGAVFAATSFAWVGHMHAGKLAAAAPLRAVGIMLLVIHLLCVAFWVGALPPLYLLSRQFGALELARHAARFGSVALRLVAVLLAAGAALGVLLLTPWSAAAWDSDYLRALILKLAAVAGLLALAAINRLRFTPRLKRGDPGGSSSLRRSIALEIVLALAILCITAVMTTLTGPPRTVNNALITIHSVRQGISI